MEERLNDPPHMEHEVEIYLHESAECGRSVGARSAKRSGCHLLTQHHIMFSINAGSKDIKLKFSHAADFPDVLLESVPSDML